MTAAAISGVPVVGDLWGNNVMMAFGKMERDEFLIRQSVNAALVFPNALTGGTLDPYFSLAAGLTQEDILYATGHTDINEFMINQIFNSTGYLLGEGMKQVAKAKHLAPGLFRWIVEDAPGYGLKLLQAYLESGQGSDMGRPSKYGK